MPDGPVRLINPNTGKPVGEEDEMLVRNIGKYPLTTEPVQTFLLPFTGKVEEGPMPLHVGLAHCGERNVVIRNGLSPVLFVSIPVGKRATATIEATIYCVGNGCDYPHGMGYLGTLTINEKDYHFLA